MSTEWPLRQDPEGPVIIALALVNDPDALGFVVLDDEDDWFISDGTELSDDVLVNRESFRKMSVREAVELLPQLTALAGVTRTRSVQQRPLPWQLANFETPNHMQ